MDQATANMLRAALPVAASAFAPLVTAGVKRAVAAAGGRVPDVLKGTITVLAGIVIAALTGGTPLDGTAGSLLGNKARDYRAGVTS